MTSVGATPPAQAPKAVKITSRCPQQPAGGRGARGVRGGGGRAAPAVFVHPVVVRFEDRSDAPGPDGPAAAEGAPTAEGGGEGGVAVRRGPGEGRRVELCRHGRDGGEAPGDALLVDHDEELLGRREGAQRCFIDPHGRHTFVGPGAVDGAQPVAGARGDVGRRVPRWRRRTGGDRDRQRPGTNESQRGGGADERQTHPAQGGGVAAAHGAGRRGVGRHNSGGKAKTVTGLCVGRVHASMLSGMASQLTMHRHCSPPCKRLVFPSSFAPGAAPSARRGPGATQLTVIAEEVETGAPTPPSDESGRCPDEVPIGEKL